MRPASPVRESYGVVGQLGAGLGAAVYADAVPIASMAMHAGNCGDGRRKSSWTGLCSLAAHCGTSIMMSMVTTPPTTIQTLTTTATADVNLLPSAAWATRTARAQGAWKVVTAAGGWSRLD